MNSSPPRRSRLDRIILTIAGIFWPSFVRRIRRIEEINIQMNFWHREERRTLAHALDAWRHGDPEAYEFWRLRHVNAALRVERDVRKALNSEEP